MCWPKRTSAALIFQLDHVISGDTITPKAETNFYLELSKPRCNLMRGRFLRVGVRPSHLRLSQITGLTFQRFTTELSLPDSPFPSTSLLLLSASFLTWLMDATRNSWAAEKKKRKKKKEMREKHTTSSHLSHLLHALSSDYWKSPRDRVRHVWL